MSCYLSSKCANFAKENIICDLKACFRMCWNTSASTFSQMNQFQGDPSIISSKVSCFTIILSTTSYLVSLTTSSVLSFHPCFRSHIYTFALYRSLGMNIDSFLVGDMYRSALKVSFQSCEMPSFFYKIFQTKFYATKSA